MIRHQRRILSRVRYTLIATMAGGSLFGACEIRLHDAVISGSKDYVSSILSQEGVLQLFFPFLFTDTGGS